MSTAVEVAVGAIARRGEALLLVRRGREPGAGLWSVPGGRVRFGESLHDAVAREVREETGLEVEVDRFAGWVERRGDGPPPFHYVILDFFVTVMGPVSEPSAGDDAAAARWVPAGEIDTLGVVPGLSEFLREVGALPGGAGG